MSNEKCNENWHIFADILKPNEVCRCGKKKTTETVGKLEDIKAEL